MPINASDYAFTSEEDFKTKTGLGDFSTVAEIAPGSTTSTDYYKYAGNPQVYSQKSFALTPTSGFSVDIPKTPVPSTALAADSSFDVSATLKDYFSKTDEILGQFKTLSSPSPEAAQAQKDLTALNDQYRTDTTNIEAKRIPLEFQTGQIEHAGKVYSTKAQALVDIINADTNSRAEKLNAAKLLYDTNRNTLLDTVQIYKDTAPQNIGTYTDPATGDFFVITRNPLTGQTATQKAGNVGTPDLWKENRAFGQAAGVSKPLYMKDGNPTVINAQTGKAYSSMEQLLADGYTTKDIQVVNPQIYDKERIFGSADSGFYYLNPNGSTTRLTNPTVQTGLGGLDKTQLGLLNTIQDNLRVDPDIKGFVEIRDGYDRVQTGANMKNGQGDLALLFGYMKMLDPTSVVRESEFASAREAQGTLSKWFNLPDRFFNGDQLTDEGRKHFAKAAQELYEAKRQSYDRAIDFYGGQLDTFGIPRNLGLRNFESPILNSAEEVPLAALFQNVAGVRDAYNEMVKQGLSQDVIVDALEQQLHVRIQKPDVSGPTFSPSTSNTDKGASSKAGNIIFASAGPLASKNPNPKGVIAGFDINSYATDPTHEKKIRSIYQSIPAMTTSTPVGIDVYIQQRAKGSPVKGQDILDAARLYNVDPNLMMALMQQDSSFGTKGKAVKTKNPGNVGNTDSGATQGFKSWRDGVFAVARNLSKRRVSNAIKAA